MGKGLIKNHIGDGLYEVSIQYDSRRIAKRITDLTTNIATLDQQIAEQTALVSKLKADLVNYSAARPENTVETLTALVNLRSSLSSAETFLGVIRLTRLEKARTLAYFQALPETVDVSAWCADLTTDLSGTVGLIEVPNERGVIQVRPGYEGRATYNIDRDGILQKPAGATPFNFLFNLCVFPGWQKWYPTYRHGVITSLSGDTCNVTVDAAQSRQQGLVINQEATLTGVTIEYMNCNGAAFEVGDHVVIQFSGDWKTPKVIGFVESPASCTIYLRIFANGIPLAEAGHDVAIVHGTPENEIVSPILKTDEDGYVGPFSGIRRPAYCLFHGAIRHDSDIYTPLPVTKPIIGGKTVDCYTVMYSSEYLYLYLDFPSGSGNIYATVLDLLLERSVSFEDPDDPVNGGRTVYDCDTTYELTWSGVQLSIPFSSILIEKFLPGTNITAVLPGMFGYDDFFDNSANEVGGNQDWYLGYGYPRYSEVSSAYDCCAHEVYWPEWGIETDVSPIIYNTEDEFSRISREIHFTCNGKPIPHETPLGCSWPDGNDVESYEHIENFALDGSYGSDDSDKFVRVESDSVANTFFAKNTLTDGNGINTASARTAHGDVGNFSLSWTVSMTDSAISLNYNGNGFYAMTHAEGAYFRTTLFVTASLDISYSYVHNKLTSEDIVIMTRNNGCTGAGVQFISVYRGQESGKMSAYATGQIAELIDTAVKNSSDIINIGTRLDDGLTAGQRITFAPALLKGYIFRNNGATTLSQRLQEILDLVNAERIKEGLIELTPNYYLSNAAQRHASDISRHDYRGVLYVDPPPTMEQMHTGTDGSQPAERILDAGYTQSWESYIVGENISSQSQPGVAPADIVDSWMNSPLHRANILTPEYDEAGMAEATAVSGWNYIVNTFGNAIL